MCFVTAIVTDTHITYRLKRLCCRNMGTGGMGLRFDRIRISIRVGLGLPSQTASAGVDVVEKLVEND